MSNKANKGRNNQEINPLSFIGETDNPLRPDEMAGRNPILASKKPPEDFLKLTQVKSIYISTSNKKEKPDILIKREENQQGERKLWRLDIPQIGGQEMSVRYGDKALRESPDVLRKAIKKNVSFTGYRPEWVNLFYIPRLFSNYSYPSLRRFNGQPVKPLYVFGADNRLVFRDPGYPWGCVGKVYSSLGTYGSAALVARNTVVTASHVVPWDSNNWWMRFVPAYYDGISLHGTGFESYVSDARGFKVEAGEHVGYDWAVLRLYSPLGEQLGYFGFNGYNDDWEDDPYWTGVGYPVAVANGERPSYQSSISIFDDDGDSHGGRELESRCDSSGGNSGGPMFGWWDNDPRLIGVYSGYEVDVLIIPPFHEYGNIISGGSGFTQLIAWARSNWLSP